MPRSRRGGLLVLSAAALVFVASLTADRPTTSVPSLASVEERDWRGSVSAFPMPGTATAHPDTHLSFRGAVPDHFGELEVVGSESGRHPGAIHADPDGGATFRPYEPFRPGEQVTVRTGLDVRGGHAEGFRFAVANPADIGDFEEHAPPSGPENTEPATLRHYHTFHTLPGLRPPKVDVLDAADDHSGGSVFLAPKRSAVQSGPMILDGEGDPVWFRSLPDKAAYDLEVQRYRGEQVLTWWEGAPGPGYATGELVIADASYREIARIEAGNGYGADLHEFVITPRDTALLLSYAPVQWDLSSVGGPQRGPVLEAVVQEIDIDSGAVVFEWHSLGAVGLEESHEPYDDEAPAYDYIHPNSVSLAADGNLLLSARHTSAVYKLDRTTGQIIWRLGGKRSSFRLGENVRFGWQHDAQQLDDGSITIFDNGAADEDNKLRDHSRGIVLDLDTAAMTAELVREYTHPDGVLSYSQANMQTLPNGDVLLGWGSRPRLTQFAPDGDVVFDVRLPPGVQSYRAFRGHWTGRPATRPAAAAEPAGGDGAVVYASWNGATEVAKWQVLAGRSEEELQPATTAARDGFETAVAVDDPGPVIAVRAKDRGGSTLGTSEPVRVRPGGR